MWYHQGCFLNSFNHHVHHYSPQYHRKCFCILQDHHSCFHVLWKYCGCLWNSYNCHKCLHDLQNPCDHLHNLQNCCTHFSWPLKYLQSRLHITGPYAIAFAFHMSRDWKFSQAELVEQSSLFLESKAEETESWRTWKVDMEGGCIGLGKKMTTLRL